MKKKELKQRIVELEKEVERLEAIIEGMEKYAEIMKPAPQPSPFQPYEPTPEPQPWIKFPIVTWERFPTETVSDTTQGYPEGTWVTFN